MFNINRKTYIIRKADGSIYKIAFSGNSMICLSRHHKGQIWYEPALSAVKCTETFWTEEIPILMNAHPDFCAFIDFQDCVHVLCQDKSDNMVYIQLNGKMDKSDRIIANENCSFLPNRHPQMARTGNRLMLCHLSGKQDDNCITSYISEKGGVSQPVLVDNAAPGKMPYLMAADNTNCTWLIYEKINNGARIQGYRKFRENTGQWSEFQPLPDCGYHSGILSAAFDSFNNLYIIRQTYHNGNYGMICSSRQVNAEKWLDSLVPVSSCYDLHNSSILAFGNCLLIYWVTGSVIYYSLSFDWGYTWSRAESYKFKGYSPLYCTVYRHNSLSEYTGCYLNPLPGKIDDGFRLAFLNEFCPRPEKMVIDELKYIIGRLLKKNPQKAGHHPHGHRLENELLPAETEIPDIQEKKDAAEIPDLQKTKEVQEEKQEETPDIPPKKKSRHNTACNGILNAPSDTGQAENKKPLMPGSGFSGITEDYLKRGR